MHVHVVGIRYWCNILVICGKMVFENHVQYFPENHPMCHCGVSREVHPMKVPHMNPRDWLHTWVHSDVKPPVGTK